MTLQTLSDLWLQELNREDIEIALELLVFEEQHVANLEQKVTAA